MAGICLVEAYCVGIRNLQTMTTQIRLPHALI